MDNNTDIIPPRIKLYRQATISGYENFIDSDSGLLIGIWKYFRIETINFKNDSNIQRPYYNMLLSQRNHVIDNIILLINMINSKENIVFNTIHTHIQKYVFYKNDLTIVNRNIVKYCK